MSSVTKTSTPSVQRPADRPTMRVLGFSLLAAILVILFFGAMLGFFFGSVVGQEFAPDSFTRRKFSFHEIPLIGLQITPIYRQSVTNNLEAHLTAKQFVVPLNTPEPKQRWDLVVARRSMTPEGGRVISQGDARILCEYLDAQDSKDQSIWLEWTNQHPELAKVVWPAVAKVAREELYSFAPDLLLLAHNATNPTQLKADLDSLLAEKYITFGRTQQQLNNHNAAIELFTAAISLVPSRADAFEARAKSLAASGTGDKGAADLTEAERLRAGT